jgi:hypothetical protein
MFYRLEMLHVSANHLPEKHHVFLYGTGVKVADDPAGVAAEKAEKLVPVLEAAGR